MKPCLIQRCTYEEKGNTNLGKISEHYETDYMGSAEFEFGALPESLRRMGKDIGEYNLFDFIINGKQVWFWTKEKDMKEYVEILEKYAKNKYDPDISLKERTHFPCYYDEKEIQDFKDGEKKYQKKLKNKNYKSTPWENVWWDIENDLVFSFDINAIVNWPVCLKNSIKYMDEQKQKKEECITQPQISRYVNVMASRINIDGKFEIYTSAEREWRVLDTWEIIDIGNGNPHFARNVNTVNKKGGF